MLQTSFFVCWIANSLKITISYNFSNENTQTEQFQVLLCSPKSCLVESEWATKVEVYTHYNHNTDTSTTCVITTTTAATSTSIDFNSCPAPSALTKWPTTTPETSSATFSTAAFSTVTTNTPNVEGQQVQQTQPLPSPRPISVTPTQQSPSEQSILKVRLWSEQLVKGGGEGQASYSPSARLKQRLLLQPCSSLWLLPVQNRQHRLLRKRQRLEPNLMFQASQNQNDNTEKKVLLWLSLQRKETKFFLFFFLQALYYYILFRLSWKW